MVVRPHASSQSCLRTTLCGKGKYDLDGSLEVQLGKTQDLLIIHSSDVLKTNSNTLRFYYRVIAGRG